MIEINGQEALRLMRVAIEKRGGDTVIDGSGCYYVTGQDGYEPMINEEGDRFTESVRPGCLVGEALVEAVGLDAVINGIGLVSNGEKINTFAHDLPNRIGVTLTGEALNYFVTAQDEQDSQASWDEAYASAVLEMASE